MLYAQITNYPDHSRIYHPISPNPNILQPKELGGIRLWSKVNIPHRSGKRSGGSWLHPTESLRPWTKAMVILLEEILDKLGYMFTKKHLKEITNISIFALHIIAFRSCPSNSVNAELIFVHLRSRPRTSGSHVIAYHCCRKTKSLKGRYCSVSFLRLSLASELSTYWKYWTPILASNSGTAVDTCGHLTLMKKSSPAMRASLFEVRYVDLSWCLIVQLYCVSILLQICQAASILQLQSISRPSVADSDIWNCNAGMWTREVDVFRENNRSVEESL